MILKINLANKIFLQTIKLEKLYLIFFNANIIIKRMKKIAYFWGL